jgi:glucose-1-phosphate thymidylyltransferase
VASIDDDAGGGELAFNSFVVERDEISGALKRGQRDHPHQIAVRTKVFLFLLRFVKPRHPACDLGLELVVRESELGHETCPSLLNVGTKRESVGRGPVVDCTEPPARSLEGENEAEVIVDVILPVAGLGTRLRPQTWSKPKPLIEVAGKPMLGHVLDRILPLQPTRLVFITGFLGEQIEAWARETYDMPLAFVEQPQMLGQTDAIIRTRGIAERDALVLFPDMLFEVDFSILQTTDADVVTFTKDVDDPSAYGVAVEEAGHVVRLVEKPKDPISRKALIGMYWFRDIAELYAAIDEQMARGIKLKNEYFLADAVQLMIDGGSRVVTAPVAVWEDCGNVDALLATNRYLLERMGSSGRSISGVAIVEPSVVDPTATVERAVVGPHASIGVGATVRDAVIRDAIIDQGAVVESAVIAHTIVGRYAEVRGRAARLNVGDTSVVQL